MINIQITTKWNSVRTYWNNVAQKLYEQNEKKKTRPIRFFIWNLKYIINYNGQSKLSDGDEQFFCCCCIFTLSIFSI